MTTLDRDDELDALLKRFDPAHALDPRSAARVSRMVLTRIASETKAKPRFSLSRLLGLWGGVPRYAGSLALGLALGLAVGLSGATSTASQDGTGAAQLYAQAQTLTPLGL
ncbi:MAG: hypothetical protein HYU59_14810 [Magnetospirillum gryphiswaldense]|nr:hypothetical protein [Magnetospirillum gryphiswaldense]